MRWLKIKCNSSEALGKVMVIRPYFLFLLMGAIATSGITQSVDAATSRANQTVAATQIDTRSCFFFNLSGVSEAGPVVAGATWFSLPISDPNYQVKVATILSAKLAGKTISVITDGSVSCGYATAIEIGFS